MYTPKLRSVDKILLTLVFLVLSASSIAWSLADKTPPAWDPADHLIAAYDYYFNLAQFNFAGFVEEFFVAPHYYAPLVHLVTAFFFLIFGASKVTGIAVNLVALAVLLLSVSWIGRTLYAGSPNESEANAKPYGLAATVLAPSLVSCYHFPAWLLHDAFLDYPLIAIVALTFACLIHARDFQSRRDAVLFGVVFAMGVLTKQTFLMFLALPMLYVTVRVAWSRNVRAMANLGLAAAIVVAIASIWYAPHLDDVIEIYQANRVAAINENEAPLFSYRSNLFYPHALLSTQMQLPFAILFVVGLVHSLVRWRRESVLLYLWLAGGIAAFTLIANKDPRYTVPVLPAAALLSVSWLIRRRDDQQSTKRPASPIWLRRVGQKVRISVVIAAAGWALVSFFNAQWPRPGIGTYVDTPDFRWMVFARNYFTLDHRPQSDDWSLPAIVTAVRDFDDRPHSIDTPEIPTGLNASWQVNGSSGALLRPDPAGERLTVGVVVNLPYLNPSTVALYARLLNSERGAPPMFIVDWLVVSSAEDRVHQCDFLVIRSGLDRAEWVAPLERPVEELIRDNPDYFSRMASFRIPIEGAEAVVYRSKARSTSNDSRQNGLHTERVADNSKASNATGGSTLPYGYSLQSADEDLPVLPRSCDSQHGVLSRGRHFCGGSSGATRLSSPVGQCRIKRQARSRAVSV